MRLVEVPLVLSVAVLSFLAGAIVALIASAVLRRSERFRHWLATVRGGEQFKCLCGKRATMPYIVGEWHLYPRWFGNRHVNGMACSVACARVVDRSPAELRKTLEITDVVRWLSGTLHEGEGRWIAESDDWAQRMAEELVETSERNR
jgi:hypothetical protein